MENQQKSTKKPIIIAIVAFLVIGAIIGNKSKKGSSSSSNSSNYSSSSSSSNSSQKSSSDPCSDMTAYNRGYSEGSNNKNMMADCDYFWEMDNDGQMSKSCFCKGYNIGHNN
jgi:hypothetical protein